MGVSIGWQKVNPRTTWITPGARSQMHQMLEESGMYGRLTRSDILTLQAMAEATHNDLRAAFEALVTAIEKHEEILVVCEF